MMSEYKSNKLSCGAKTRLVDQGSSNGVAATHQVSSFVDVLLETVVLGTCRISTVLAVAVLSHDDMMLNVLVWRQSQSL